MKRSLILSLSAPFAFILAACAPEHATVSPIKTQTAAASVNTVLNHQDWPKNEWWKAYNDPQLNGLIAKALSDAPDMQIARKRITLAEAQAKAAMAADGPQIDFSADAERQKMSAEGLMGPFALTDPAAGTTGPWYTNGIFGLTAGWDLDLWGKNRARVEARIGKVNAQKAELEQTRQLLASSVARLYWEWQTQAAAGEVLAQIKHEQDNIIGADRELYQHGITSSVEGVETDIDANKTEEQLAEVNGKMKAVEARLVALTNSSSVTLTQHALPTVDAALPPTLGYELLARRPDLQEAHWYIEASMSEVEAARAAFYPDVNLMAFLQQDALHLSDLFRASAQQMGVTAGLTLPIFDSGRLNASLDIAQAQNNLSVANYNKAVVEAVNQVARTASEVETLTAKNHHQQQVEKDAARVVALAQARFSAGIVAGSRVSEARIPALREDLAGLLLKGQYVDATLQLTSALGGGYHHG
ncbi:multidrug resistance outer membrane protein MdtQ [Enterobacter cloacae complex sp. ECL405]|uniref:Multidrug resistance outer membrane protein MdtQ n=1 Tax=Enterobacter asburiae TaxID=61645 RepID=A0AAQ0J802_ENTAS|nr:MULTISPECIES: multidrug resistance outer membrane protein MdtQ [Enterobacter cloacae complex]QBB05831.1 multidrug resistance outer membrane protein MdtQ [Enterobacter cloacae]MBF1983493.1 multidrug resistance outer membrane protein MdtQ [Enterobacter asburiae]MBJ6585315.1 multidrug resistance outer membrane protein MdtQ [Enterobacter asburiae]MCC2909941.1 multidrug resistance outer membrane protein MdtQ [Enterobacter asburiae]MCE1340410.1 multidrug resistance outer membrane protein MdtQ [En